MINNEKRETDFQKQLKEKACEKVQEAHKRLENGRKYLKNTKPDQITIEDILEAFGFSKNGIESE